MHALLFVHICRIYPRLGVIGDPICLRARARALTPSYLFFLPWKPMRASNNTCLPLLLHCQAGHLFFFGEGLNESKS
jgi:hypothetical protein